MSKPLDIDFDHTLCDMDNLRRGYKMGPPMLGALEAVRGLQERGYNLRVFTVRATTAPGTKAVEDWLRFFHFPDMPVSAIKRDADILDNRAIHFTDWYTAMGVLRG